MALRTGADNKTESVPPELIGTISQPIADGVVHYLESIDNKLGSLTEQISAMSIQMTNMCKRVDRLEGQIYGNGHTGLATKVNAIVYGISAILAGVAFIVAEIVSKLF